MDSTALIPNLVGLASSINSWLLSEAAPKPSVRTRLHNSCSSPAGWSSNLVAHVVEWHHWAHASMKKLLHVISILAAIVWPVPVMLLLSSASNESLPGGHASWVVLAIQVPPCRVSPGAAWAGTAAAVSIMDC